VQGVVRAAFVLPYWVDERNKVFMLAPVEKKDGKKKLSLFGGKADGRTGAGDRGDRRWMDVALRELREESCLPWCDGVPPSRPQKRAQEKSDAHAAFWQGAETFLYESIKFGDAVFLAGGEDGRSKAVFARWPVPRDLIVHAKNMVPAFDKLKEEPNGEIEVHPDDFTGTCSVELRVVELVQRDRGHQGCRVTPADNPENSWTLDTALKNTTLKWLRDRFGQAAQDAAGVEELVAGVGSLGVAPATGP